MKKHTNQPDEIIDGTPVRRAFSGAVIKSIDSAKRQIEFIISNAAVDRYGDIVEVAGWDLKNYKTNPVVLFGHMSSIPPIGKAIRTWKDGDALRSIAEFMPQDISAFAYSIFRMYEEKFLRAVSVGFRPLKWERIKDDEGNETWSYRFQKQELLEFSAVPIPANPEALVAARQKGIDTAPFKQWAEEMLDRWNETSVPLKSLYGVERKEIENIRRRASGSGSVFRVPPDVQDALMKKNLAAVRAAKAAKAKEDSKHTSVTIRGIAYELPIMVPDKDVGSVIINTDEINGKKSYHIDSAADKASFTKELLDMESDFLNIASREEGDDAEKGVILTLKGDDSVVEYNLLGFDEASNVLFGVKISEKNIFADAEVVDLTKGEEEDDEEEKGKKKPADEDEEDKATDDDADEDEDDEDKSSDDDDDADDEDDDDKGMDDEDDEDGDEKSSKADDEDEEEKGKGKKKPKPADEDEDDAEKAMDFGTYLLFVSDAIAGFEDKLDGEEGVQRSRREQRRMEFLAGHMREMADRLDGGKGAGKTVKDPDDGASKKGKKSVKNELTADEAQEYIKSVSESLQPLLTEIVASKISKIRGRLD